MCPYGIYAPVGNCHKSNEWAQWTSEISDTNQRVRKYQTDALSKLCCVCYIHAEILSLFIFLKNSSSSCTSRLVFSLVLLFFMVSTYSSTEIVYPTNPFSRSFFERTKFVFEKHPNLYKFCERLSETLRTRYAVAAYWTHRYLDTWEKKTIRDIWLAFHNFTGLWIISRLFSE